MATSSKDVGLRVTHSNARGLPIIYNRAIEIGDADNVIVFVHDDVWIDDFFIARRLLDGLERFDVVGVAGNTRRVSGQWTWAHVPGVKGIDADYLSGAVAHGNEPFGPVTEFGESPAPCELLDGVLLAARRRTLQDAGVRFDERFRFHFYDLDFCRSARAAGLTLGTWPIAVTHQSRGAFGAPDWHAACDLYLEKWQEPKLPR